MQGFAADGDLAPWDRISDFETTPVSLWQWVYPQGYVFTRYVTETYGDDLRNQWLRAMTGDQDIAGATQTVLGMSFEMLDAAFLVWLADQPG